MIHLPRKPCVLVLALLALCAAAPVAAACRGSPWFDEHGNVLQPPPVDLDGDGVVDPIESSRESGAGGASYTITVHLSREGESLSVTAEVSFYSIIAFTPVPEWLRGRGRVKLRAAVEDALFGRVCDRPDPSLQWLLDPKHTLRWQQGRPSFPDGYAIYSEARDAVWVNYGGFNHRRAGKARYPDGRIDEAPLLKDFRVLQSQGDLRLLGTGHGVVLEDAGAGRHAWIWVTGGGQKLRFPTIASARFEGDDAIVELSLPQAETHGRIRVQLADGAVHEERCHKDDFDWQRRRCRTGKAR